jgi:hypothetical protein
MCIEAWRHLANSRDDANVRLGSGYLNDGRVICEYRMHVAGTLTVINVQMPLTGSCARRKIGTLSHL